MGDISLAEAKAHLSEVVERARSGEQIRITRRGKPVAEIIAVRTARKPIDVGALRAMTDRMPHQREGARDFMRGVRDAERY
jgi:prevent-host-death family protein